MFNQWLQNKLLSSLYPNLTEPRPQEALTTTTKLGWSCLSHVKSFLLPLGSYQSIMGSRGSFGEQKTTKTVWRSITAQGAGLFGLNCPRVTAGIFRGAVCCLPLLRPDYSGRIFVHNNRFWAPVFEVTTLSNITSQYTVRIVLISTFRKAKFQNYEANIDRDRVSYVRRRFY